MRRRAEQVDRTKLRITEAAMRLHTTIGPSEASMSAVAEEAGVTRLTLYRHFSSMDDLFFACMGHWRSLHPPPDPRVWSEVADLEPRLRRALAEVYGWYAANAEDLYPIYRDAAHTPASNRAARRATNERMVDALLQGIPMRGAAGRRLRAAVGHVVGFWTWRSLAVDGGLSIRDAVDLATTFAMVARD
ncbi:MAG: TetR/AcrR family transcriptional regulator [Chloroflexi bacterium]|nr:TetR/AcrR family transcriptional regulator [Chloroflexota bacterium]